MEIWYPPISAFWLRRNLMFGQIGDRIQPCVGDIGGIEPVEDLFRRQCAKNTIDDPVQRIPVGKAVRIVDESVSPSASAASARTVAQNDLNSRLLCTESNTCPHHRRETPHKAQRRCVLTPCVWAHHPNSDAPSKACSSNLPSHQTLKSKYQFHHRSGRAGSRLSGLQKTPSSP